MEVEIHKLYCNHSETLIMTTPTGTLYSNYAETYPESLYCTWLIDLTSIAQPGQVVKLTFVRPVRLDYWGGDSVIIQENDSPLSPIIVHLTASSYFFTPPPPFLSETRKQYT